MSSPVSTITSNVNLLLLDTYNIVNSNQPYVAYVSSVTAPGKIATIRDSTGNLGTNFFKIRVSTTSGVSFVDGTNFFDITQPFGYVTMSSRDRNTWNILNAYAFPDPYGISYVSTVNVRDRFTTPSVFASSFVSTVNVNTRSISSFNIQATNISTNNIFVNTISTNNLFTNSISSISIKAINISTNTVNTSNISSIRSWFNNVSTLTFNSSNIINANQITTSNIFTSNVLFNNGCNNDTYIYTSTFVDINTTTHRLLTYSNIVETNYVASDWSYFGAKNNVISNVSQATILNSVQTNLIMPTSLLITTSVSDPVNATLDVDIYNNTNTTPFTFTNTGFSNYSFILYFNGINFCNNNIGDAGYYFYLSNSTQNSPSFGRHFNNTDSNYFVQVGSQIFNTDRTNFTISDIFDLSGWSNNDVIYLYLHTYNGGSNIVQFNDNVKLSIVYQPLYS
jgi:hypothetical protein